MIYGYARISRKTQDIERQIRNILAVYPSAKIYQEAYTGTKIEGRTEFNKLYKKLKANDTIVFDSVSRMSRNEYDGIKLYFDLLEKGVNLIFLKEHYIDTDIYKESMRDKLELQGTDEDEIFKGLNNYFRKLAHKQIRIAFQQSEKEVQDLRQRTREGIETARLNGKQIGRKEGAKVTTQKSIEMKAKIQKMAKSFGGNMTDQETLETLGLARNTYFKYKREILENLC